MENNEFTFELRILGIFALEAEIRAHSQYIEHNVAFKHTEIHYNFAEDVNHR